MMRRFMPSMAVILRPSFGRGISGDVSDLNAIAWLLAENLAFMAKEPGKDISV